MVDSTQLDTVLEIGDLLHHEIEGRYPFPNNFIILLQTSK